MTREQLYEDALQAIISEITEVRNKLQGAGVSKRSEERLVLINKIDRVAREAVKRD